MEKQPLTRRVKVSMPEELYHRLTLHTPYYGSRSNILRIALEKELERREGVSIEAVLEKGLKKARLILLQTERAKEAVREALKVIDETLSAIPPSP
jgi:metal-responsive CopG/Arc/MetJ family transcriptional regulator